VLISAIGAATTRIRVGSGGVMLPHYSPLKVAENFSMLGGLYGDRVDLAIGRAPGSDPITAYALQRDRRTAGPDDFPEQLTEPRVVVAVWALCADTDEEAVRLAASSRMAFTLFLQGQLIPVPPVEVGVKFVEEHGAEIEALGRRRRWLVGSPATVKTGIEAA